FASRRQFIDHGNIEIAIDCHGQTAWNGRRSHYQHIWVQSATADLCPLQDTEPMLLIDHCQAEPFEFDALLNQRVRADDDVNLTRSERCLRFALLFRL